MLKLSLFCALAPGGASAWIFASFFSPLGKLLHMSTPWSVFQSLTIAEIKKLSVIMGSLSQEYKNFTSGFLPESAFRGSH